MAPPTTGNYNHPPPHEARRKLRNNGYIRLHTPTTTHITTTHTDKQQTVRIPDVTEWRPVLGNDKGTKQERPRPCSNGHSL